MKSQNHNRKLSWQQSTLPPISSVHTRVCGPIKFLQLGPARYMNSDAGAPKCGATLSEQTGARTGSRTLNLEPGFMKLSKSGQQQPGSLDPQHPTTPHPTAGHLVLLGPRSKAVAGPVPHHTRLSLRATPPRRVPGRSPSSLAGLHLGLILLEQHFRGRHLPTQVSSRAGLLHGHLLRGLALRSATATCLTSARGAGLQLSNFQGGVGCEVRP